MPALLARGFRPFFLAVGLVGPLDVVVWLAALRGQLPLPAWLDPVAWHAHEMVFGFVSAAVAGFLLTSVPVWTASRAVTGRPLALLVALWAAGRLGLALAGVLPAGVVAALDLSFLPALALAVGRPLLAARQGRNLGFPVVLAALFAANLCVHLEAVGLAAGTARPALRAAVGLVVLLVVVIGGRITPAFTANALARRGGTARIREPRPLAPACAVAVVAWIACEVLRGPSAWTALVALLAAGLLVARLAGWQTRHVLDDPLLWSLHLGYAWVPLGLAGLALAHGTGWVPGSSAWHALTSGAMGAMILAVVTRVALGHTGRPLVAPPGIASAYVLVSLAAALRSLGPVVAPAQARAWLLASGLAWAAAFLVFLVVYAPILVRPRVDGKPG